MESLEHINMDVPRTASVHRRFELAPECSELDRGECPWRDYPAVRCCVANEFTKDLRCV
jgi:hypothetical protein